MDRSASIMSLWSESLNFVMLILLLVLSVDSRYGGSESVKLAKEGYFLSFECVEVISRLHFYLCFKWSKFFTCLDVIDFGLNFSGLFQLSMRFSSCRDILMDSLHIRLYSIVYRTHL